MIIQAGKTKEGTDRSNIIQAGRRFAGTHTAAAPETSGQAGDMLAAILGCPDRIGMAELSKSDPTKFSMCYTAKRPLGKVILFGGIAALFFLLKR